MLIHTKYLLSLGLFRLVVITMLGILIKNMALGLTTAIIMVYLQNNVVRLEPL